jgi:hypothetical protein
VVDLGEVGDELLVAQELLLQDRGAVDGLGELKRSDLLGAEAPFQAGQALVFGPV